MTDHNYMLCIDCCGCSRYKDKLCKLIALGTIEHVVSFKTMLLLKCIHMLLLKKMQSNGIHNYAPMAEAIHAMDSASQQMVKREGNIAFVTMKENMAFQKLKPICKLEEHNGVYLRSGYKANKACLTFMEYIFLEQQNIFVNALSVMKFYFAQSNATTDSGNAEDELS